MAAADDNKLSAETRTAFGKGAARRIRAVGKIPAVLYGHGTDPRHLTLPGHELMLITRKANAVLDLQLDSGSQLALVKDIQTDPVRQIIEHVDLVVVRAGERVTVDVPVHVEGESAPDSIVQLDQATLSVEVEATHIPERFTVSVEGLEVGTQIKAGEVEIGNATLVSDPESLVVGITEPQAVDLPEPEDGEGEESEDGEGSAEGESSESGDADSDSE